MDGFDAAGFVFLPRLDLGNPEPRLTAELSFLVPPLLMDVSEINTHIVRCDETVFLRHCCR